MLAVVAADRITLARTRPRLLSPAAGESGHRGWRVFVSARSRILGWSIALLAAAAAASTIATHAFLVSTMNARIHGELTHEIAEFRALAARNGALSGSDTHDDHGAPSAAPRITVLGLLRSRTRSAVLEPDTVLIGLISNRIVTTSANFRAALGPGTDVLARWSASTGQTAGTVAMAAGPPPTRPCPSGYPGAPSAACSWLPC